MAKDKKSGLYLIVAAILIPWRLQFIAFTHTHSEKKLWGHLSRCAYNNVYITIYIHKGCILYIQTTFMGYAYTAP
jgi:hypothetical protein